MRTSFFSSSCNNRTAAALTGNAAKKSWVKGDLKFDLFIQIRTTRAKMLKKSSSVYIWARAEEDANLGFIASFQENLF